MTTTKNRPEIDGLRALAVVPVVLFHAGMGFAGGYVGVDVFFVISGYLITSIILNDLKSGAFRIANFWERRVRRIMPALAVMVLATIGLGWFFLLPSDFDELGRSVVAQTLLISNVFFWQQTGYFTADAIQPLLHTWSLAVEEQFYLLFPFFLLALKRIRENWTAPAICLVGAISFGLNVYLTRTHAMAAFYLLPPRAWELLLGALLAALPVSAKPVRWFNEGLSFAGLAGIALAALFYTKETRFPGMAALPPCLGAAAIIWSNAPTRTFVGHLLSLRPVVFVGLISYSLYLWHWPVLVFANYGAEDYLPIGARVLAVLGSLLLAVISWRWVETPFRKRSIGAHRPTLFALAATASACLLVAGWLIHRQEGLEQRWPVTALRYFAARQDREARRDVDLAAAIRGNLTALGSTRVDAPLELLVWGDSHARAVLPVLDAICTDFKIRGTAATHAATVPLLGFKNTKPFSLGDDSAAYNQAIVNYVRTKRVKNILIVARWSAYLPSSQSDQSEAEFREALGRTIRELRATGARIFVMKEVPGHRFDVPRTLAIAVARSRDLNLIGMPTEDHLARTRLENAVLDELSANSVVVLDPVPLLADQNGLCRVEREGHALYADRHHLTTYGAMQLRPLFDKMFRSEVAAVP